MLETPFAANGSGCRKEDGMNEKELNLLYARLSKDDGEDGVSNSITNQLELLRDFAERNGFIPYMTVQDDGYSGTNFNRPGWQELVSLVESGRVSTIICKDSSRMARNYLQAGLYREMFRRNRQYIGDTVNLRTMVENFKSKKVKKCPEDEWLIFPGTHEAIVSQETWELVQKLRETPRRIDHLGEANPLTGLRYCSQCGAKLYNHRKAHPEKPTHTKLTDVYCCSTFKLSNSKFDTQCTPHHISTESVRNIILEVLRKTSGYVREHEADFVKKVREFTTVREGETAKSYKKQINKNEHRIDEIEKVYRSLYEDKALGKISEEMFSEMTGGYERERNELREKTDALQAELGAFTADSMRADKFIELVRRYTSFEELTPAMLNEFIDKVVVHEGKWSEGVGENGRPRGSRTQRVDVFLKYIGGFDVPDMRSPEQIEADRIAEEKIEKRRAYHREKTRRWAERKRAAEAEPVKQNPAA